MAKPVSYLKDIEGRNFVADLASRTRFHLSMDGVSILTVEGTNLHDTWEGVEIDGKPYSVHISFFDTDLGFDDWYTNRCTAEIFAVEELDGANEVDENGIPCFTQVDTSSEIQVRIGFSGVDPRELFAELSTPNQDARVATVDRIMGNPDWCDSDSHEEFLTDVLTNLRHWAKAMGVDFDEAVKTSENHFTEES